MGVGKVGVVGLCFTPLSASKKEWLICLLNQTENSCLIKRIALP